MKYLYLYLTSQTRPRGLNDLFVNIYRSYLYCQKVERTLLIDFSTTVYKCNLHNILSFKQHNIICDTNKIYTILNKSNDKIFPDKKVRHLVGLNKSTDWNNEVVNIHLSGWGCEKNNPIHSDTLKKNPELVWFFIFSSIVLNTRLQKHCKKGFKVLPKKYSAIQIRNTDRQSNFSKIIHDNKNNLSKTIYVATDDANCIASLKKYYLEYNFVNLITFPDKYFTLHTCNLDGKTKLFDIFRDLYIISKSNNFYTNSQGNFAKLCNFIFKNKKLMEL